MTLFIIITHQHRITFNFTWNSVIKINSKNVLKRWKKRHASIWNETHYVANAFHGCKFQWKWNVIRNWWNYLHWKSANQIKCIMLAIIWCRRRKTLCLIVNNCHLKISLIESQELSQFTVHAKTYQKYFSAFNRFRKEFSANNFVCHWCAFEKSMYSICTRFQNQHSGWFRQNHILSMYFLNFKVHVVVFTSVKHQLNEWDVECWISELKRL